MQAFGEFVNIRGALRHQAQDDGAAYLARQVGQCHHALHYAVAYVAHRARVAAVIVVVILAVHILGQVVHAALDAFGRHGRHISPDVARLRCRVSGIFGQPLFLLVPFSGQYGFGRGLFAVCDGHAVLAVVGVRP